MLTPAPGNWYLLFSLPNAICLPTLVSDHRTLFSSKPLPQEATNSGTSSLAGCAFYLCSLQYTPISKQSNWYTCVFLFILYLTEQQASQHSLGDRARHPMWSQTVSLNPLVLLGGLSQRMDRNSWVSSSCRIYLGLRTSPECSMYSMCWLKCSFQEVPGGSHMQKEALCSSRSWTGSWKNSLPQFYGHFQKN